MTRDFLPVSERDDRRNAAYIEMPCGDRVFVGVNFCKAHMRFKPRSSTFKMRRHHLAWSAPLCPEINDDGNAAALDMRGEAGISEFDSSPCEQCAFTAATGGVFLQSIFRNPVDRVTARAGDMMIVVHGASSLSVAIYRKWGEAAGIQELPVA